MTTTFHVATVGEVGDTYKRGPDGMGAVIEHWPALDVRLYQHPKRATHSFAVQYGRQVDAKLTYGDACAKLGQALLHALACDGKIDNERD